MASTGDTDRSAGDKAAIGSGPPSGGGDRPVPAANEPAIGEKTREMPEYARGQARAGAGRGGSVGRGGSADRGVGWPDEADDIGRPLDTGRYDGAAREELAGVRPARGRGCLFALVGVIALVAALVIGMRAVGFWPHWSNPFAEQQTDRSQRPLLKSIQDLSRFTAAQGNFQVVVDLQNDRKYVPDFLINHRTLFVGVGSVEAYVDFSTIGEGAVVESADGTSVEIKLPAPQLGEANLNIEDSYVYAEQRGLFNRIRDAFAGDPNRQKETYQRAEEEITRAAKDTELLQRAQENTRKMLEGLLRSLGYQKVTVTFTTP
jgi:hypothetical protein